MLILIVVDLTIFASLAFAHLHVSMRAEVCPPPGARLPADAVAVDGAGAVRRSSLAIAQAARRTPRAVAATLARPLGSGCAQIAGLLLAIAATTRPRPSRC